MEGNLLYKDFNIFTKKPHIFLNLNTTITKNLNVIKTTNLNDLIVNNYSQLKGQLIADNIYTNKNLTVFNESTFQGPIYSNHKVKINYEEDSSNITSGSFQLLGGAGIKKNVFIGGNTTISKNLNVLQNTNITNDLHVSEQTILSKNLNVLQNVNITNDLYVSKNATISTNLNVLNTTTISKYLNVEDDTTISKNLNVHQNINISESLYVNQNLTVSKDSKFNANLDIYGNLTVHGSKVNIISEKTLISDPLIVFGTNQSKSTIDNHHGGFVIAHKNKFSGLLRTPESSQFYLYRDINEKSDNEPDLTNLSNLADLHIYNLNSTHITSNKLHILQNSTLVGNTNILSNLNVSDHIKTKHLTVSDTFISNKHAIFNNNLNVHVQDPIFHKNLNIYGNSTINDLTINSNFNALNSQSTLQNVTINGNNTIKANLNVLQNINVTDGVFAKDITVSGNLVVSGNHTLIITNHLDINDPIITIANTKNDTRDRGLLIAKKNNNYTGLIRKDTDENFYLLDNVSNPYLTDLPTTSVSTLILKNINTSSNSIINGTTFIANNDTTNKNDIIANFPNNTSTQNIQFYKSTQFNKNVTVHSNINLTGNLSVSDKFILLDTNSLVSRGRSDFYGTTNLYGPTHVSGMVDFKQSSLSFDHLKVRSYIQSDNTIQTKNQHISNILQIPIGATNSFNKPGSIYFNTTSNLYEAFNNSQWLPMGGINPYKDTTITNNLNIDMNLNVSQNINCNNTVTSKNSICKETITTKNIQISTLLKVPTNASSSNTLGSLYYDTGSQSYKGYTDNGWVSLSESPSSDVSFANNITINKNLNVIQNINSTDTITTKTAKINNFLKIPVLNTNSNNTPGSIFFNTSSNLYEAFNNSQWLPMGGINPYKDTTITNNLNIDMNLNVFQNINCDDTITTNTNIINDILIIPKHNGQHPKLSNIQGSIYFNTTEKMYEGYLSETDGWEPLGGFSKNKDATIHKNLFVMKNLNVSQNINCNDTITSNTNIINNLLQIPISKSINNTNINALYIYNTNTAPNNLMIGSSKIAYDNNITQLSVSTDLFQFYNVQKNSPIFGNRVTGLNDPTMNTFSKYYTIKEYTFFEQTNITHIEFYISHSIHNISAAEQSFKITIKKNNIDTSVLNKEYTNITVGSVISNLSLDTTLTFNPNDKLSIQLTLNNTANEYNGHEIFARLYGHTQISPQINNLKLTSNNDYNNTPPALEVTGGATFGGSVKAGGTVLTFTGSHLAKIISPLNYESFYTNNDNYNYTFKSGLIVSVSNSTKIDINNSEFNTILSNKMNDSTVFGVISKHINSNNYIINSLGEGAIWVSNITGDVQNGDYISSSSILGYGCKQQTTTLHNYTVAKCCSVINWNSISTYITSNNNRYKIAFVACTYHCG
jgi:carbonic anhydrase/acetyltransferase-like protein (isoleucine patch superfamily)